MDYKRILTLHYTDGMSGRGIAEATGVGKTTVNEFLKRFRECSELSYPLPEEVTNEFFAERLYHKVGKPTDELYRDFDPEALCRALTRKDETLKHLWKKYYAAGEVDGKQPLSYRQYCRRYQNWLGSKNVTFHDPPDFPMETPRVALQLWRCPVSVWSLTTPVSRCGCVTYTTLNGNRK